MRRLTFVWIPALVGPCLFAACVLPAYEVTSSTSGGAGGTTTTGGGGTGTTSSSSSTTSSTSSSSSGDCAAPCTPPTECQTGACVGGQCVFENVAAGTPITSQVTGDCKSIQCDGAGHTMTVDAATDTLDDGKECTNDVCQGGVSVSVPVTTGTACTQNGGKKCNAAGDCVACLNNGDCANGVCQSFACVPTTCADSTKNGSETDVDCGGSCSPCAPNKHCAMGSDCTTGVCVGTLCQSATCNDSTQNGGESDVDCGGTTVCARCLDGKHCTAGGDCVGGACTAAQKCCTPAGMSATCSSKCGMVQDNCGGAVDCGGCQAPMTCGGGGVPNVCGAPSVGAIWSKSFPSGNSLIDTVVADGSGNALFAGYIANSVDFGGGPLTSAGSFDGFLAKLDSDGNHLWSKRFGNSGADAVYGPALDGAGNIVITGSFSASVDWGAGVLTSLGGGDIFVGKYGPSGNAIWTRRYGDTSGQGGNAVATDTAGNIYVGGSFYGNFNFGAGANIVATSTTSYDAFAAKLDTNGTQVWAKGLGSSGTSEAADRIAVDGSGNVYVAGRTEGLSNFGGSTLPLSARIFLLKLGPTGNHLWSKGYGASVPGTVAALRVDGNGDVLLGGTLYGTVDFGGGPLPCTSSCGFIVKLDAAGNHLWSRYYSGGDSSDVRGIALGASNELFVPGILRGTVDLGGGPVTSADPMGYDVYLLQLTAAGAFVKLRKYTSGYGGPAVLDPSGNILMSGIVKSTLDLGAGPMTGTSVSYLAKLMP